MNIKIRNEEAKDYRTVETIMREAFWNLYCPGCNEHYIFHNLREHPDCIPALTLVIELDGEVVGSIIFSHAKVIDSRGNEYPVISFGPVAILPRLHRKGLGRQLITHSIQRAKELGYSAIIIGGFPYHYQTYGFVGAKKYNISMPDGQYYTGIMALPLFDGALDGVTGVVHFSAGMYPDESGLEAFDKQFPEKEKKVTESQARFEKAASEIDSNDYV